MIQSKFKVSAAILLIIALIGGLFFGYILSEVDKGEELQLLTTYQPTTPTKLYDINGIPFAELYRHRQELLRFGDIPPHVVNAFLSVEDTNFYNHVGIDFWAILRAAWVNLIHFKVKQGGSTITQQLSKAILKNTKKSFIRKFIEALLTLQIEQEYSKEEILEIYFNLVYLGHGTTGLSSASAVYFSKDIRDLDIAEAAVLARLPKAPVKYSPFKNPDIAKRAHKVVLRLMAENGFLPKSSTEKIHNEFWEKFWPVVITRAPSASTWGTKLDRAPYFTEHVRKQLIKELGEDIVYTGGLKVYTTLDIKKQEIAEDEFIKSLISYDKTSFGASLSYKGGADSSLVGIYNMLGSIFPVASPYISKFDESANFRSQLEEELIEAADILSITSPLENEASAVGEFRKRSAVFSKNLHVEGAMITLEQSTGYIQTMIGGTKFTPKNQFNRAMAARRQTGSAFKPFVYGAGIEERSIGTGTGLMDGPITSMTDEGQSWAPEGMSGQYMGMVPASRALALSLNIVSVQVYFRIGDDPIIDFASKLTKASPGRFPRNPTLALGVAELTPFEMALGYGVIANKGREIIPFSLRYVVNQSGAVIYNKEADVRKTLAEKAEKGTIQVIPEATAFIMRKMLQHVADNGTPAAAIRSPEQGNFKGDAGGKTGSTSSFTNAWYAGFDPKYTTVIWIGYDKNTISLGRGMTGAVIAAPVWGKFYRRIYEGKELSYFKDANGNDPVPEGVIGGGTCAFNGLSPKPGVCPTTGNWFLAPTTINGVTKSYGGSGPCDGDRDHSKTMDFRDYLQKEMNITNEEIGKDKNSTFRVKPD
ncbi:MAG: transglycosylase domain-containing protein [Leptospiraceae bacterium]|nr:transglycosylase domain-containing protein [Leptospiraceae bacterium]